MLFVRQRQRGDPVVGSEYKRTETKLVFRRTVRDASQVNSTAITQYMILYNLRISWFQGSVYTIN